MFWILLASCLFFMWVRPTYIIILLVLILINFSAGLLLPRLKEPRKNFIFVSLVLTNLSALLIFKYFEFFNANVVRVLQSLDFPHSAQTLQVVLPLGLSFHIFQSISYLTEVYTGNYPAEKNLLAFSNYIMFWPQLAAGPIERPQNLLRQFHLPTSFKAEYLTLGLRLVLIGLFKKLVIADRLAPLVSEVFNHPSSYSFLPVLLGCYAYAVQLFCDFSGYCDIARGCAKIMGFDLSENFKSPFFAQSISDYWTRWHITLSTWIRDYLYMPLAMTVARSSRHLVICVPLVAMTISGLWHGAGWSFVAWGALHGLYLVTSELTKKSRKRMVKLLRAEKFPRALHGMQIIITFHLTTFALIFFRANSLESALQLIKGACRPFSTTDLGFFQNMGNFGLASKLGLILLVVVGEWLIRNSNWENFLKIPSQPLRWGVYYLLFFFILFFGIYEERQFIYFQF